MSQEPPRRNVRDELLAGGTALPGDGGFPWLLVGVGAAAALAAVVWWVSSDGGARARAATATPEAGVAAPPMAAPAAEPPPPPAPAEPDQGLRAAAAALERTLGEDQLWSTVEVDGTTAVIRTAFCQDAGLASRVTASEPALRSAGFRGVRCIEQHGAVAFQREI